MSSCRIDLGRRGPMVGQHVMRVSAGELRIGVNERTGQSRDRVKQGMLGADGELMGLDGADVGGHDDLALGPDLVADPAHPDLTQVQHTGRGPQNALSLIDQRRSAARRTAGHL
jgi:hypothetical protein